MLDEAIQKEIIQKGRDFLKSPLERDPYEEAFESDQDRKLPQPPLVKAPMAEEGERIAPAVREFLQANARLDSVIEQVASSRTEIIRVSAYASIAMHWLPGIIQRFREECPDVDVDIRMADHVDVPYELLAQGKMDAILVSPQDEGQYEWVHLADDPMFAVLPRDFDTQGMTAFPLAAFEARDFIMPSQGFDKDIMRIFNRIGVKPHILPTWVDDPTVISMVSHGLGVSMMTELTVRGRTDGVKLLPVEPASSRELGLAVRSLDAASDGLRHFIDCTKRVVAEMQPAKLAAMESHWETARDVPFYLLVWPDPDNERNSVQALGIPGLLSWIAYEHTDAEVKGLKDFPKEDRPPVTPVFWSFRLMVALGMLFLLLSLAATLQRKREMPCRGLLKALVWNIPLPYISIMLGWAVAEIGRQPWIVHGLMRTTDAVSPVPAENVAISLGAFIVVYSLLGVLDIYLLRKYAIKGPDAQEA